MELSATHAEWLQNKLDTVEELYKYLMKEHEVLREFTKLEKQVSHENCLSEEEVRVCKHFKKRTKLIN